MMRRRDYLWLGAVLAIFAGAYVALGVIAYAAWVL